MSTAAGPDIIESGLVYHVDPILSKSCRDLTYNIHPSPLDIFAWHSLAPGTNTCIVSRDTTLTSPVGGIPFKMVTTGNDSHVGTYNNPVFNLAPTRIGDTWTVSVWARADKATTGAIFIFGNTNSGSSFLEAPAGGFSITTSWQRFSFTYTMVNPGSLYMQTRLDGADTFDGATIWWDGLQVEKSSTMSEFTSRKSTTLYDLSSNNYNATIVNNPNYVSENGGVLGLDGVKDHVIFSSTIKPTISTLTGFSIGMWVFQTPTQVGAFWNYFFISGALEMGTYGTGAGTFTMKDNAATGGPNVNTGNISLGWNYIVFGTDSSRIPFMHHYNTTTNSYVTSGTFNPATYTIDKLFQGFNSYTSYYGAKIGAIQIYNRALSTAEVIQNFNALRSKYRI
jgi:hypothetical protein